MDVSKWFPVNIRLKRGCVMSPWLFNAYMDGMVREVNARMLGKGPGWFEINVCNLRMKQNQWPTQCRSCLDW